jgi:hypothetical protein
VASIRSAKGIKDVGRIDEDLAVTVVEAIEKKCRKARDHRYKVDPILLVEVLPGMTTAEDLARLLAQSQFPSDCLFAGVYGIGRFPVAKVSTGGYSTGGPRVISIKHSSLTENLPKEEYAALLPLWMARNNGSGQKQSYRAEKNVP